MIVITRDNLDLIRPSNTSTMPDHLVNELKNRQQFLDLFRYVMEIKQRGPDTSTSVTQTLVRRELSPELNGLVLMQNLNCVACHLSNSRQSPVAAKQAPRLKWSTAALNPNYIAAFVANPHLVKPGSTMPESLGPLDEMDRKHASTAITHFLLSKTKNEFQPQPIDFEAAHRGFALFHSVGCVACHAPRNESAIEQPADDSIPLGNLSAKYNISGLTSFLEDPLASRPSGHMPNMQLTHRETVNVSNFLLQSTNQAFSKWTRDARLAEQGERLYARHNCASCHTELTGVNTHSTSQLTLEELNPERGCLSGQQGTWPNFRLQSHERDSIVAALQKHPMKLDDNQKIEVTLASFNCTACHDRGDFGGVTSERNHYFRTTNLNLGDQGRIPPTLTQVGAKLNPKWMRDVLVNHRSIRPYMKTRMPQYGEVNIGHLVNLFAENDHISDTKFAEFDDQKAMREKGHLLAGDKGLNCVACHTYQFKASDTMPAVDLTEMTERLKKDWFYQYMLAPQTFSLNTVMPSFWPGGRAIRTDIEGSSNEQIEAIWQYLIDGRQAKAPSGVVREPLEIIVTDEAQMLRRSFPGIGKRGIGVGYPGGVNIAFDAEQLRLGAIWRGKFVEASGVWRGQGSGRIRPLSRSIEFAKGPDLDNADNPWVVDDERPTDHQFKGYTLDKSQRPTFRYVFDSVEVEDFFSQVMDQGTNKHLLRRTVTMLSAENRKRLRFRIASAEEITEIDGIFSVGEKLKIRVVSAQSARVTGDQNPKRLEIPIELSPAKRQQLVIEYLWE